jgi:hypothetical protein
MKTRLLVAGGFVALATLVVLAGYAVFELRVAFPADYRIAFQMPEPNDLANGVDKSVGMLFSLTLGLFVLAGFVLRGLDPERRRSRFVVAAGVGFLFGSMFAIYMGFTARNVALYFASFRTEAAISLAGTFIGLQLLGVTLSALAAILLLVDYLMPLHEAAAKAPRRRPRSARS